MSNLIINKKATLNYEIIDKFLAGISLFGSEVKSVKNKNGSLSGSFLIVQKNQVILKSAYIPPWQEKNSEFDSYRERYLLLQKSEIRKIEKEMKNKGITLIPLVFVLKNNLVKLEIAVARGNKKHDKRQNLKKKAVQRDIERDLKIKTK